MQVLYQFIQGDQCIIYPIIYIIVIAILKIVALSMNCHIDLTGCIKNFTLSDCEDDGIRKNAGMWYVNDPDLREEILT